MFTDISYSYIYVINVLLNSVYVYHSALKRFLNIIQYHKNKFYALKF